MLGGEESEESEVSMDVNKYECAALHFSEARASSARAFRGLDSKECERAIVRHLLTRLVDISESKLEVAYFSAEK